MAIKKAIVTGASSGIGKGIYDFLCEEENYDVLGISRRGPDCKIDLSHLAEIDTFITNLFGWKVQVDLVINCAGIMLLDEGRFIDYYYCNNKSTFPLLYTNLISVWYMLEKFYEYNIFRIGASVINIASVAGVTGDSSVPLYASTKAGIISLTKSFAKKFIQNNIRVNSISPGFVADTNLVKTPTPQELINTIPMKREAEISELLPVIRMLINCEYITGQNIVVDGGLSL